VLPDQDSILVAGYPMGGDSLSITKGIVSRVVMTRYAHASNKLLGIQIDAAINPGNSGGPAFSDLQEVRAVPGCAVLCALCTCPLPGSFLLTMLPAPSSPCLEADLVMAVPSGWLVMAMPIGWLEPA
jgi:hypothetical protein